MSPWFLIVYMNAVMKEVKIKLERSGEVEDCLSSGKQITWFYVGSRRKHKRQWWEKKSESQCWEEQGNSAELRGMNGV